MTAQILERVGFFGELGYDEMPGAPSLLDACNKRGPANKDKVVAYLRSGALFIISPGYAEDYFDGSHAGKLSFLTDGTYAWPGSLAHYVDRYDVALPAEFEQFMEANAWTVPSGIDPIGLAFRPTP